MTNEQTTTAANVAQQGANVAPEKGSSKKAATTKKSAPKGRKAGKGPKRNKTAQAKKTARPEPKATAPRAESKGARILALIRRPKGASLAELMKASGWQAHSVRGFISNAQKKHGVSIESTKSESADRIYLLKR